MQSDGAAKLWLHKRGLTDAMIERHDLGVTRAKSGNRHLPAITIPIPNADGTAYYQKKRIAPWLTEDELKTALGNKWEDIYKPWSQAGIPARTWFTYLPVEAAST